MTSSSNVSPAARQSLGLKRGAQRHHLVWIDVSQRRPADHPGHAGAHERKPRRPTDQHNALHLGNRDAGIGQHVGGDVERAPDGLGNHRLELGARQRMERGRACEFQAPRRLVALGELFLHLARQRQRGLDRGFIDLVGDAVVLAFRQHAFGDGAVEIVAAKGCVAAGRQNLEHTFLKPQ